MHLQFWNLISKFVSLGATWGILEAETDTGVLAALLFEWLEHLKSPILDRNGITYVVIHCDDVEAALQRLPMHVGYILEYLIRFVARLKLDGDKSQSLLMRFVASLTHQSVTIGNSTFPDAKLQFPKLRGGTADSTLKFMLKLLEMIEKEQNNGEQFQEFKAKFTSLSNGSEQKIEKMDVDDMNSLKVNSNSRQSSAVAS